MSKAKTSNLPPAALLTATTIFAANSTIISPKRLSLPEIGGDIFVKRHTLAERDDYNAAISAADKDDKNALGVTLVACDEAGNLLFTADDIEQIKGLASIITTKILYEYNIINGFITPIADAVDDAKKNS